MKKNIEKILLSEHTEEAQAFISEVESKYLSACTGLCNEVKALGLEITSKDYLLNLINGHFEQLTLDYWKISQPDVDSLQSMAAKEAMKKTIEEKLQEFLRFVFKQFSKPIIVFGENRAMTDEYFQQYISFGSDGPYLSEESKAEITESFREYIMDPKLIRVYESQHQAAEALQTLWNALDQAQMTTSTNPTFMMNLFDITVVSREEGIYKIVPKPLNFK